MVSHFAQNQGGNPLTKIKLKDISSYEGKREMESLMRLETL